MLCPHIVLEFNFGTTEVIAKQHRKTKEVWQEIYRLLVEEGKYFE
jgi:hypothetical protein